MNANALLYLANSSRKSDKMLGVEHFVAFLHEFNHTG